MVIACLSAVDKREYLMANADLSTLSLPPVTILMGVCGCGKTEVGLRLASLTGGIFHDGDDFHPPENVAKMARNEPLDDSDRTPWLERIRSEAIVPALESDAGSVFVACSALKRIHRDRLRAGLPADRVWFVHLQGSRDLITRRMRARQGHFMKAEMVASQFATLEVPAGDERAVTVNVNATVDEVAREAIRALDAAFARRREGVKA